MIPLGQILPPLTPAIILAYYSLNKHDDGDRVWVLLKRMHPSKYLEIQSMNVWEALWVENF